MFLNACYFIVPLVLGQFYVNEAAVVESISTQNAPNLWAEAQKLLSILQDTVQNSIDNSITTLSSIRNNLETQSEYAVDHAEAKIRDSYQKTISKLNSLKDITLDVGMNSTCNSRNNLISLQQILLNRSLSCIDEELAYATLTTDASILMVKAANNVVVDLANRLGACGVSNITCIAGMIGELTTQLVELPFKIGVFVRQIQVYMDAYQVSIENCAALNIVVFDSDCVQVVREASSCVYKEIHDVLTKNFMMFLR